MRSFTGVHRRAHHHVGVPREEEKKGDRDTLPIVRDDHDKVRRRNRTFNSWVKPSRHLSTSSAFVEYGKTFFLPTLAVFSLVYCAFFEPGNVRPTGINGLEIAMGGAGSRDVVLPGAFESTEKGFYAPYYDYTFDLLTDDDNFMRNIAYTGYEEIFGRDTFEDEKNLKRYKYAFDDDEKRNPYRGWGVHNKNHLERKNHCRQTALRKETFFSTCNDFHSLGFDSFVSKARAFYIGGGSFRDVFRLNEANGDPYVILKTASYSGVKYRPHNFELYRMDTSVANALSPHPLVVDIYGSCALAMFSEVMPRGDVDVVSVPKYHRSRCDETDINGQDHLVKMNDINPTTKLIWALQMAESVALLHNHPKGVIVHDDVQTLQWLIADDGHIKMNDFNRAEFMLYDEEHGMYCRYKNGPGPGDFRAPEEYKNEPLDEQIDIFSLGNNFYALLTGLYPIHELCDEDKVGGHIRRGERAFIDSRWSKASFAEAELARIIVQCWHQRRNDRPSIGMLVLWLRESVEKNREFLSQGRTN